MRALARYPVKSMAGEPLAELNLRWPGIHGDRQYAFYRVGDRSRFPWLTARDLPDLVLHRPAFDDPGDPRRSAVAVSLASGERVPLDAPELAARLSAASGVDVGLMQLGRGIFDSMPVSVASTASLAAVEAAHGAPLDPRRFWLNIVIDSDQADLDWCSAILTFGEGDDGARLLVNEAVPRCAMITVDPDTAERDASVMRTVAQRFDNKVGLYCVPAALGRIRVGDPVRLATQAA